MSSSSDVIAGGPTLRDGPGGPAGPSLRLQVIEKGSGWPRIDFGELWLYRDLFGFLVWRDIKVRYAQTVLGAGWALLQPLLTMVVFTVIFGSFAGIPSDGIPYPAFSLAGVALWTYFSSTLTGASNSLVASTSLITKVYFPRLVIPFAPVLAGLVDFAIAFLLLVGVLFYYGITPSPWALLAVPGVLLVTVLTVSGVGCWLAALNVQFRDVKYITPFLVQIWMYASPIVYPMSMVPERYHALYSLNPMVAPIEGFRSVLLNGSPPGVVPIAISTTVALVIFVSGTLYFRQTERVFADVA